MSNPIVNVTHLVFEYPGQRALDDVGFNIAPNSVTALVGPNGAGKTTLMRCLCGLIRPLEGEIVVDGVNVIEEPRASHERIGYLSDLFGLYDELNVRQALRFAATSNGLSTDVDGAILRCAKGLNLHERLDQSIGKLSRGLRQRVAIGQAIIHEPRVLILDEPASGLDPEARHALAELFKSLQRAGMSLLVSSHILAELEAYATDMLVMRNGRVVEHSELGASKQKRRALRIRLNNNINDAAALLEAHAAVSELKIVDNEIECAFDGDDVLQQSLLKTLIDSHVPIISFAEAEYDLQRSYLESIAGRHQS